jgi:hypothetical protein
MALTALRSMSNASTTRRPPQRLHSSTSSRNTRRSSSAQGSREGGRARAAAFDPRSPGGSTGPSDTAPAQRASASGGRSTIASRQDALGAKLRGSGPGGGGAAAPASLAAQELRRLQHQHLAAVPERALESVREATIGQRGQPLQRQWRASPVGAKALQSLTVVGVQVHPRV